MRPLRIALAAVAAVLLGGCMTAAYVGGSLVNLHKPSFNGSGVLDLTLRVDGDDVRVLAPVGCRSFHHPMAGVQVTRDSGSLFLLTLASGERAIADLGYGCELSDASITWNPSTARYLYRVRTSPRLVVLRDIIVPAAHPDSAAAHVVLRRGFVRESNEATNAVRVADIATALREAGLSQSNVTLMAVFSSNIDGRGPYIDATDAAKLDASTGTVLVEGELRRKITKNLPPRGWNSDGSDAAISRALQTVAFDFDERESVFVPAKSISGRLTYFAMPPSICPNDASPCRNRLVIARIGDRDFPFDDVRLVYDPERRRAFVPQLERLR